MTGVVLACVTNRGVRNLSHRLPVGEDYEKQSPFVPPIDALSPAAGHVQPVEVACAGGNIGLCMLVRGYIYPRTNRAERKGRQWNTDQFRLTEFNREIGKSV